MQGIHETKLDDLAREIWLRQAVSDAHQLARRLDNLAASIAQELGIDPDSDAITDAIFNTLDLTNALGILSDARQSVATSPVESFLADACLVTGDPDDFIYATVIKSGFNLWLELRGEGKWGERTVSLKLKEQAGRYRDAYTGKTFATGKRDAPVYLGIRFRDAFHKTIEAALGTSSGDGGAA